MTDETAPLLRANSLSDESYLIRKRALEIKSILNQIQFSVERRYELHSIVFLKKGEFAQMMENLRFLHEQIRASQTAQKGKGWVVTTENYHSVDKGQCKETKEFGCKKRGRIIRDGR